MKRGHCKELNEILTSKPNILERYGIIIIISILLLIISVLSNCKYTEQTRISKITSLDNREKSILIAQLDKNKDPSLLINHNFTLIIDGHSFICRGIEFQDTEKNINLFLKPHSIESYDSIQSIITSNPNVKLIETQQNYFGIVINPILKIFNKK